MTTRTYKTEFPDFVLDVEIPPGFEDNSWHNDTMPNWYHEGKQLHLWIDYTDDSLREMPGAGSKFMLIQADLEQIHSCEGEILADTNDYNDILQEIEKCKHITSSKI